MVKIIDERTKAELGPVLAGLSGTVKLVFFTQKNACLGCSQQEELLRELCALSGKLKLEVYDFVQNSDMARNYKIDKIPATAVVGSKDYGIRFYGLTQGYEFTSLLEDILMVSGGASRLEPQLEELVRAIADPVHLQIMVTLTCQYCPAMVHTAHQFAFVNDRIRADMIEMAEFPQLAQKYGVSAVPKTVVNETSSFDGALPAASVYLKIMQAIAPDSMAEAERRVRQITGDNKTWEAKEAHDYEVAIVGGGPAAMSAAIYATRKGLDVVLIAGKLGGQINYTAGIDNYLGLSGISGAEMTEVFRAHMEQFPVAEAIGPLVTGIDASGTGFTLATSDNRRFTARSVIYCAGKEYLRLGVPGEEKFIGRGIGFCATCDAPLFHGKRVAVVGGGNSAFTSVRDLISFASEIHLISRNPHFKADTLLVEEIKKSKNVVIHTPMVVREFLGDGELTGVRVESLDKMAKTDLAVDGVFLEIGLNPNSGPVKNLVELDKYGQIPVNRDQSTGRPGFFAAGDITDVEEKQISIAVGQGAQAALTAYKYLAEHKLTKSKTSLKESWE